ncbi:MAG TPA: thioredoxin domain-containing protein [Acidimicrobiia bacterium]|nr:thioredoxin domain-containing protein [Acidimicrobiia bacterium]
MPTPPPGARHTNRLADETSPYLLQHAHNPVDWYPWGEAALSRARELERPIFLSIGYAACHWCHVMERESFEDEATAADLNEHFVSIKVDREERPDLDAIYMAAVQTMTGQGGWPMSVFLTPDGRPFYGGTYFPNEPRHGMPSFRQLLARIAEAWADQRDEVEATATRLAEHIRAGQQVPSGLGEAEAAQPAVDATDRLVQAREALSSSFDARNGGWGGAPKFPASMTIELLLREYVRSGDRQARLMAGKTLDAMADGGIYDHLGGGFARYATDAIWLVPHFEKMLYDNAQLGRVYLHAWQVTGDERYAAVARETLDFMAHELRNPPSGAFASSLDADTEGVEGATYVWSRGQVRGVLGEDAALFEAAYGVTDRGNWEGHTILTRARSDTALAAELGRPREEIAEALSRARVKLHRARGARPQPARDDKVLTAWNGLTIAAFAEAGRAFSDEGYRRIAAEAADFVLGEMRTPEGRLLRSWKDGPAQHAAVLEDHAHLADGLLALYEATFEERWFSAARHLADLILTHFAAADGGFHDTADDAEALIARPRSLQDNALPSGGAMATLVLLRLAALTGEGRYRDAAERALMPIVPAAAQYPTAFSQWLQALQLASEPIDEVAIVGDPDADDTRALLAVVFDGHRPGRVVAVSETPDASAIPLLHGRSQLDGHATAYVCHGFACLRPTTDSAELAQQLMASTIADSN